MRTAFTLGLLLLPAAAFAHGGDGIPSGFADGLGHPIGGADHLLAMVAVGLWAALTGGAARWAYPSSFLGGMVAGGLLGLAGAALPAMEPAILASVIVLGAAVALAARAPLGIACAGLALFGLAHGNAHGLEAFEGGAAYVAGFLIGTAVLHAFGLGAGLAAMRVPVVVRSLGALTALGGAALALS